MILLFFGVAFCVAGIVSSIVTGGWTIIPALLLAFGLALLLLNLWLWGKKRQLWQSRSTKQGASAIAKTAVVLLVIGAINWAGVSYGKTWDFTENKIYTLSEQSQNIVSDLARPLEVIIFDRNNNSELEQLLENYRRYSDRFEFKFVNPERQIGLAQQYGVQSLGEIYLSYGDKQQKLEVGNSALGETLTETQLTNAIERIKRDRPTNIYFLQGHGESPLEMVEGGLAQAITNLEDRGNIVRELNLATTGKIPDDANLIIIAGASRKLLAAEVSTLQQYLKAGGNLLLLLSPNTDLGITAIWQNWGIELDNRLIVDGSGEGNVMGFGPAVAIVNNYGEHPITASFRNGISLFPETRPLKVIEKEGISSVAIAKTDEQTWAESDLREEQITFDVNRDLSGPLNVAIAATREEPNTARLVVFGSTTFATNGWFEQQLNGDILLNSISWLVGDDKNVLTIRPQELTNRRINLSSLQVAIISWLALRIMPFIALVIGVYLWWKRR